MTDEDQKYREIREQGRQDGIADGRKGYVLVESGRAHREPELGERCSEGMLITEHTRVAQPPLPTEPYTVIRVTWQDQEAQQRKSGHVFTLFEDGLWGIASPEQIRERITGFEVLAVPVQTAEVRAFDLVREERADLARQFEEVRRETFAQTYDQTRRETAKAVLDRVGSKRHDFSTLTDADVDDLAREFGVES